MSNKKPKMPSRATFVKSILRRASFHWKPRNEAFKLARVSRGKYKCAICEELFGPKEVALDHILPVIDPRVGFTGWDSYIDKLFCDVEGFQVICHSCHDAKTRVEDSLREHYKTPKDEIPKFKHRKKSLDKQTEEDI